MTLLIPALVFTRIYGRITTRIPNEYDPMRELKSPYSLNRKYYIITKIEDLILRNGVSFPNEESLLFIGRKGR
jgi:hypothetical protein